MSIEDFVPKEHVIIEHITPTGKMFIRSDDTDYAELMKNLEPREDDN